MEDFFFSLVMKVEASVSPPQRDSQDDDLFVTVLSILRRGAFFPPTRRRAWHRRTFSQLLPLFYRRTIDLRRSFSFPKHENSCLSFLLLKGDTFSPTPTVVSSLLFPPMEPFKLGAMELFLASYRFFF